MATLPQWIEARVIQKIATEAEWNEITLVPYKGEVCLVGDSGGKVVNIKIGDGINTFPNLDYMFDSIQQNVGYIAIESNALPTPEGDVAWGMVTDGTYTFGGSDVFTVPDGHWGIANYSSGAWSLMDMGELPSPEVSNNTGKSESIAASQNLTSVSIIDEKKKSTKVTSLLTNKIKGNIITDNTWRNAQGGDEYYCAYINVNEGDDIIINVTPTASVFMAFLSQADIPVNNVEASVVPGYGYRELQESESFIVPEGAKILYVNLGLVSLNYNRTPESIYINGINVIDDILIRENNTISRQSDTREKSRIFNPLEIKRIGNIFRDSSSDPYLWRNVSNETVSHNIVPVFKGDIVGIAPNIKEQGAIFALLRYDLKDLKDRNYVPFVSGTTRQTINEYTEITIEQDCYLYYYTSGTYTPYIFINGANTMYSDLELSTINSYDFYDVGYYYQTNNQTPITRVNYYHVSIPVDSGDTILFEGGSNYAFLTSTDYPLTNGKSVSFLSGHTQVYSVTTSPVTIPTGCTNLYVYLGSFVDGDLDRRPNKIFKNGVELNLDFIEDKHVGNISGTTWTNSLERKYKATNKFPVAKFPYIVLESYAAVPFLQDVVSFFSKDGIRVAYINPLSFNNPLKRVITYQDIIDEDGVIQYFPGYSKDDLYTMQVINEENINPKPFFRSNIKLLDIQESLVDRINEQSNEIAKNESYARQELLIFEDNFDTLEPYWQGVNFDSSTYMVTWSTDSDVMFVKDSILHLVCKKVEDGNRAFKSPFIKTTNKLEFQEGRIDVKMRMDTSYGFGGGAWSIGTYPKWADCWELDYMETFGQTSWQSPTNNAHYSSGGVNQSLGSSQYGEIDISKWHVYSVEWSQEKIMFFVDDIKVREVLVDTLNADYPISTMDLRFNIKAGQPDIVIDHNDMEDSATLYVDYIKVYTTKENGGKYPLTDITVPSSININIGQTLYVNPTYIPSNATQTAFELSSSNDSVARIREDWFIKDKGITGVSAGSATITVTSADGTIVKTIDVTVS